MIDPRDAVASEFTAHLLQVSFTAPRGWSEAQIEEHTSDVLDSVKRMMPRADRQTLKDLAERVRVRLRRDAKTMAWPMLGEIEKAFRQEMSERREDAPSGDTAHPNAVHYARTWLARFNEWPQNLSEPDAVFRALLGEFSGKEMIEAGFPASVECAAKHGVFRTARGAEMRDAMRRMD